MTVGAVERSPEVDISSVQSALREESLDGWLLYDFRGLNPIAADITGVARQEGHLATRRWFYLIPASGEPRALVHEIEPGALAHLPGIPRRYAGRVQLEAGVRDILTGLGRIAMEYSPGCAIPYVSRVDAGTIELVRQTGVEVVSSGDLVQRFSAIWDAWQVDTHLTASAALYRIKDRAFDAIARRLRDSLATTEYDIQQLMSGWFHEEGLVSDSAPVVAAQENAGSPHYLPTVAHTRTIGRSELVLLDLWGKLDRPRAVFADISWVCYTGPQVPERLADAFQAAAAARDAAVRLVQSRTTARQEVRGWEVDRAASTVLREAGYGAQILHRTGHSLGETVHGLGVNMDDYETHDDRRLMPGTGFTIEPGLYFPDFGVRTEINMIVRGASAEVSGPVQSAIVALV
jgi:Xaa-Pro aminopeptidase